VYALGKAGMSALRRRSEARAGNYSTAVGMYVGNGLSLSILETVVHLLVLVAGVIRAWVIGGLRSRWCLNPDPRLSCRRPGYRQFQLMRAHGHELGRSTQRDLNLDIIISTIYMPLGVRKIQRPSCPISPLTTDIIYSP
jgi:hypothetical protein